MDKLVHGFFSPTARRVDGSIWHSNPDGSGKFIEVTEVTDNPYYGKQQFEEGLEDTIYVGLVGPFVEVANLVNWD